MVNCAVQDMRKVRLDSKHGCIPFATSDCICELCLSTLGRCPIQEDEATMHILGKHRDCFKKAYDIHKLAVLKFCRDLA